MFDHYMTFKRFIINSFKTLNPGVEYADNWHLDALSAVLEEVRLGEIKRLIINMPPRYLKSISTSVAHVAWILANEPEARIIVASYSKHLSEKHSIDTRLIIQSDWFQKAFPWCKIQKGQDRKDKFVTTKRGFRFATSVMGSLTGEGGDYLIIDDPHNPNYVNSKLRREKVIEWFNTTFQSRLDDKKKGAIILVMQRLHEDDLSGYLLKKNDEAIKNGGKKIWTHLNFPAMTYEKNIIELKNYQIVRYAGPLNEKRQTEEDLEQTKNEVGSLVYNAQYQQNPESQNNGLVKKAWFKYYDLQDIKLIPPEFHSWDFAIKIGSENDYSVCSKWFICKGNFYLVDLQRVKLEYPFLKKHVTKEIISDNYPCVIIEDKASGQSMIQDLKNHFLDLNNKPRIIPINPKLDKITRFASVSSFFESGKVFFPKNAHFLNDLEDELLRFPTSSHDDQVDSVSQFLNYVKLCRKSYYGLRNI